MREVEQLVSGHAPGSQPSDARDPSLARHVLRFEVTGEVLASFREALSKLRRDAGEALDDDARAAIGGYLAGHQRGRLGTVATSPKMFGLDERDLRDPFAGYVARFLA